MTELASNELEEMAEIAELDSEIEGEVGLLNVADGLDTLEAAVDVADLSRVALAPGAI